VTDTQPELMVGFPAERIVDIARWDKGPDNRWAFQHVSEIVPTANVSGGDGSPFVWQESTANVGGLSVEINDEDSLSVESILLSTYTDGFLVTKNGRVAFEGYFNGMDRHTRHLLMSVSKSVVGTLAGVAVDRGLLDPAAAVVSYIPELEDSPGFADATVRNVLDMTTAIIFSEDYDDPESEVVAHEMACAWRGRSSIADQGVYEFARSTRRADREHGELFHYASINTDVLGWLIERSTAQRLSDFASESIWAHIGVEHDGQLGVDYRGSPVANGGFCFTLRDLSRFGEMMLNRGRINDSQIVSTEWINNTLNQGSNTAWLPTLYGPLWPNGRYRNQWYVTGDDHGSYFAIGVNGQHLWINPTTQVVITKFSSHPASVDKDAMLLTIEAMNTIARSPTLS